MAKPVSSAIKTAVELDAAPDGLDRGLSSPFVMLDIPTITVMGPAPVAFNFNHVPCAGIVHRIDLQPTTARLISVIVDGEAQMIWRSMPPLLEQPYVGWINDWLRLEPSICLRPGQPLLVIAALPEGSQKIDARMTLYRIREREKA